MSAYANLSAMSSHGGHYLAQTRSGVLAEGAPPLCAGDTHQCPLCLPNGSPHPPLPLCAPPLTNVLVGGRPWLSQGDLHLCVGPTSIQTGCFSIQRDSKLPTLPEESQHETEPTRFRYST